MTVTLFVATSLDGYIAGPDDDLSWLFTDADYGFSDFYERVDTLIMGRGTYEVVKKMGAWPYDGKATVVVSHRDLEVDTPFTTSFNGELKELLTNLEEDGATDVWLVGGGELVRSFLKENLIDEIQVSLHPVLLGTGVPLFPDGFTKTFLKLKDQVVYDNGLVQLQYGVVKS